MNLIIDCGNTNLKYFIFKDQSLVLTNLFKWEGDWSLKIIKNFPDLKNILLSDVTGKYNKEELEKKFPNNRIYDVKALDFPFETNYNKENLGVDRIGLIIAAINKFPKVDCLVIDAGSCLTFDLISSKSVHKGGLISPGLLMRFKSLSQHTSKLPYINFEDKITEIGIDTEDSIQSGTLEGFIFEINGQIEKFKRKTPNLKVILTGGDSKYLYKRIKNSIFAEQEFLASGLNNLLKCNNL
jgi:type III pantothenate kinase